MYRDKMMAEKKNGKRKGRGNQRTGRAGEYYVAAELNRRGAYAVTFTGNMPEIDVMASNDDTNRTVYIQVKTKRVDNWHISPKEGNKRRKEDTFWVFVDLPDSGSAPRFWITPDWWIRANITETLAVRLEKNPGINRERHYLLEKHIGRMERLLGYPGALG